MIDALIDIAGKFIWDNPLVLWLLCIAVFSSIGYRADRKMRENARADRQLAEVDRYDPEEPVGM